MKIKKIYTYKNGIVMTTFSKAKTIAMTEAEAKAYILENSDFKKTLTENTLDVYYGMIGALDMDWSKAPTFASFDEAKAVVA